MAAPSTAALAARCAKELGLPPLYHSPRDAKIICFQRFIRLFGYGSLTIVFTLHLAELGFIETKIGLLMSLTLVGDIFSSLLLTLVADKVGRRVVLAIGAALMILSGTAFWLTGRYWLLLSTSIIGIISPRSVKPCLIREHGW